VVENPKQATEAVEKLLRHYQQPVMLEEFIEGDEVTMGILGNSPPKILGMMRILSKERNDHFVYSLEVKRNYLDLVDYECPAHFGSDVLQNIEAFGLESFRALGCRDFARLDFRVSSQGVPYFLEVNPLPGLGTYSDLVIMAQMLGWTHKQLIIGVLDAALKRYPQCIRA
jgi:D-alanine-D-alanine ligase